MSKNVNQAHPLMITSGEFWRCDHGNTGFDADMNWVGCAQCHPLATEADCSVCTVTSHLLPNGKCYHCDKADKVGKLETRITELEAENKEIDARNTALEARVHYLRTGLGLLVTSTNKLLEIDQRG